MSSRHSEQLKRLLFRNFSPVNIERAKILYRSFSELKTTFKSDYVALEQAAGHAGYPLSINDIRSTLEEMGVGRGDIIHVHSSTSFLMRGSPVPPKEKYSSMLEYAAKVVQTLIEIVGKDGTILMNTDSVKRAYAFYLTGAVFDSARMPSRRGLISEVFRRTPGAMRSVHPWYNVTAWGKHAEDLLRDHEKSSPYAMDINSPWYKLNERGGKVVLLGKTFDGNSPIHCVEFVYPDEFPRPIYINRPIALKYVDKDGQVKDMPIMLHAPIWIDGAPTNFSLFLNQKYNIYKIKEFHNDVKIVSYDAKAQFDAIYREMKNDVTWYDARFYP